MNTKYTLYFVLVSIIMMSLLAACSSSYDIADIDVISGEESVAYIEKLPIECVSADYVINTKYGYTLFG